MPILWTGRCSDDPTLTPTALIAEGHAVYRDALPCVAALRRLVPGFVGVRNPTDMSAGAIGQKDIFASAVRAIAEDPAVDALIPARYSSVNMSGKAVCRAELLKRAAFTSDFKGPIFGIVARLTEQKGIDFLLANQDFFLAHECRLVVLGSGDKRMESELRELATGAPQKVFLSAKLDEAMSHLIEAGSDFFVMPSLFEPCGLNQMYSQVYGTVPVVSRVGGLADTVIDADDDPVKGTGLMCEPSAASLRDALQRALILFADKPRYAAVQQRAMMKDFSWKVAAAGYERLYQDAL
jgi:starch synthase